MENQESQFEKMKSGSEIHDKLKSALEKAEKSSQSKESNKKKTLSEGIFDGLMILVLLGIVLLVLVFDFSGFGFFHENFIAEIIAKFMMVAVGGLIWVRSKSLLYDFLFPSSHKEIIKTIYKFSPELLQTTQSEEIAEATLHRNATAHSIGVVIFALIISIFLLLNPDFVNTSGLIVSEGSLAASVIQVIIFCFIAGAYFSLRDLFSIRKEYQNLQVVLWKIQKLWPAHTGAGLIQKSLPDNHHSFTGRIMQTLFRMVLVQGQVKPEEIAAKKFQHGEFSSIIPIYMTSVMPVLGLIGTILGLTVAISGLEGVMANALSDKEAFSLHISASLSGIGTAFYTTLAGTFGMLIMKFFTLITAHARMTFLVDLRNIILAEVLPRVHSSSLIKTK